MRLVVRAFAVLVVALPIVAIVLLALALQDRPLVPATAQLAPEDIARAKKVLRAHDPRRAAGGGARVIALDEEDLTLALNYLAGQVGAGTARIDLQSGVATLQASLEAPRNPLGRYVNVEAAFRETGAVPALARLRIGSLPVPRFVADHLLRETLRHLAATDAEQLAAQLVESVRIGEGRLTVAYRWSDQAAALARSALVSPAEAQRLRAYQERLADAVSGAPRPLSLATLMAPVFGLALERGAEADPVRENRAALVVLALYVTRQPIQRIVPAAAGWRRPAARPVTLAGRGDLPQHFLVSATLAAEAGNPLADAIGLHKELQDSRGGSGFSFSDIGANRAGARFGQVASQSPARARELARALAAGVVESDFMPDVADLPEFMPEAEFNRRFGGLDSPAYAEMIATIDRRIDATPLLRR
jgi:hypothetical protein